MGQDLAAGFSRHLIDALMTDNRMTSRPTHVARHTGYTRVDSEHMIRLARGRVRTEFNRLFLYTLRST